MTSDIRLCLRTIVLTAFAASLGGCGGDVNNTAASSSAPTIAGVIATQPSKAASPSVSGSPASSVTVDASYAFRPTIGNSTGAALSFSIANRPKWARFDAANGALMGTPDSTDVGTYTDIVISVSDGSAGASLAPFSIVVTPANTVAAKISWTIPPSSGSQAAAQVVGYHIYYGESAESMIDVVNVDDPATTSFVLAGLEHGTWYFAVSSYNEAKIESVRTYAVPVSL